MKWSAYSLNLSLIENICEDFKHYFRSKKFSCISSIKKSRLNSSGIIISHDFFKIWRLREIRTNIKKILLKNHLQNINS